MKVDDEILYGARWYREHGFNALPSSLVHGSLHPAFNYADARDFGLEHESFAKLAERFDAVGIQVATGARWNLALVDLDKYEARGVWDEWVRLQRLPPTWEVEHDPGGGKHLWFRCDVELPHKTVLWGGQDHTAIEVLGERNLIVAPPTVSPKSGNPYLWRDGHSPSDCPLATMPRFVIDAVRRQAPELPAREAKPLPKLEQAAPVYGHCSMDEVIKAMDVESVALALGIKFAAPDWNAVGWRKCYRVFREERHPSAALRRDGLYWEDGLSDLQSGKMMNLFNLAVERGLARDYCHAIDLIGQMSGVQPTRK